MKKIPMRQCIGCQQMKPKNELLRVIRTPEDEICLDVTGRKNGRGAYICKNNECLENAVRRKGIERALKTAVSPEIYDRLSKEMDNIEK